LSNQSIPKPMIEVNMTCPIPVILETLPTSRIILGLRCNPTINSKIATPNQVQPRRTDDDASEDIGDDEWLFECSQQK